ncbi:pilus assembly protein [Jannaschia formosa]|uniref:pilus assembly protein n=1 Tax=Jannaschia formosa TaxID=2259592 RepID=UPI000E1B6911|nr:pilus assembly protein [Jannaschia formosa]TFL17790.1 pilus assembly protein [Jannaschia formosa]
MTDPILNARSFLAAEDGAVTVDWVVLTAALVGLGLAVMGVISSGMENLTDDINTQLNTDHITDTFGDG